MTQHDDTLYLVHMHDLAVEALALVGDLPLESFDADPGIKYGAAFLVQSIGEAANHVSRGRQSRIGRPWDRIIGMRHRIVHNYMNINFALVWATVRDERPRVVAALEHELDASGDAPR